MLVRSPGHKVGLLISLHKDLVTTSLLQGSESFAGF